MRSGSSVARVCTDQGMAAGAKYRQLLLALSYQVALAEVQLVDATTQKVINQAAEALEVSYEEHDLLRRRYALDNLVTPYTVLGVPVSASNEEIKKAYRRRAAEFHPDRVTHLGGEHVEQAHLKFLELQEAYRELEKSRGF